jgi:mRNA interferase MazF
MVTSQTSRGQYASRLIIMLDTTEVQQSGLISNSVVMADNLATVNLSAISRVIGSIAVVNLQKVLRSTFGL